MLELILKLVMAIMLATGIGRSESPALMDLAQQRSAEIVGDFGHRQMPELTDNGWWYGEVIGYNSGFDDPVSTILNGWRDSGSHWAVLTDSFYTQIGCGATYVEPRYYFVCIVGKPAGYSPPGDIVVDPPVNPPVLPDTAMSSR